jgi:hypothetical protein
VKNELVPNQIKHLFDFKKTISQKDIQKEEIGISEAKYDYMEWETKWLLGERCEKCCGK